MPRADASEPEIPDAVRLTWRELTERAIPARQAAVEKRDAAQTDVDQQSDNCRRLVVDLLRNGVRRRDLIDRPFSQGWLTRIQREAGLTRKQRAEADEETGSTT